MKLIDSFIHPFRHFRHRPSARLQQVSGGQQRQRLLPHAAPSLLRGQQQQPRRLRRRDPGRGRTLPELPLPLHVVRDAPAAAALQRVLQGLWSAASAPAAGTRRQRGQRRRRRVPADAAGGREGPTPAGKVSSTTAYTIIFQFHFFERHGALRFSPFIQVLVFEPFCSICAISA